MNADTIARLRTQFTEVIAPDDRGYDQARTVANRGVDRRPAVIIRPADAGDVSRVVTLARETGTELAVRGGGHSGAGHGVSDGGIVLDLTRLRSIDIDVDGRTAWAQTGLTAAEYTTAAGAHGLATGFGDTGSVGIGGLTLGGGVGYLVRQHGLTIDDLLAAEIVTADGEVRHVDAVHEPDLFWAIRGGGGNFGVATRFRFRLHPHDTVVGGLMVLPATPKTIASFVDAADSATEELTAIATIMAAPPMPFLPAEAHGKLVLMASVCYTGDPETAEAALAPLRAAATPIADMIRPMPYPELFSLVGEAEGPTHSVTRSEFVDAIEVGEGEAIVEHLHAASGPIALAQLRVLGGAMARVPVDQTAFAYRDRRFILAVVTAYDRVDETAQHQAWVADTAAAIGKDAGVMVSFLGDEGPARVRDAYPGPTWDRLAQIKRRYDPTNLFRLNQNIPPA